MPNYNTQFETLPSAGSNIGAGYQDIIETRIAMRERLEKEHEFDFADQTRQGLHREGSAMVEVYTGDALNMPPSTRPSSGAALTAADKGFIVFHKARGAFYIWDGTAFLDSREVGALKTDAIAEKTADTGVTIEGTKFENKDVSGTNRNTAVVDHLTLTELVSGECSLKSNRLTVKELVIPIGAPDGGAIVGSIWIE